MATYSEIQDYVKKHSGFVPKTCWIAHVKELSGLRPRVAANRYDIHERQVPCPEDKIRPIQEALMHFGMLSGER